MNERTDEENVFIDTVTLYPSTRNITQALRKRRKSCHWQQSGWPLRTLY